MLSHVLSSCDATLPKSPIAFEIAKGWMASKDPVRRSCGYRLVYELAKDKKEPFADGAIRHDTNRRREGAYVSVKLTVTVTIASKPIGVYFHCLTASIADWANTPFVDRKTVTSPIVPSA